MSTNAGKKAAVPAASAGVGSNDIVTALAVLANALLPRLLAARAGGGCGGCDAQENGIMYCLDGAVQVYPFPPDGDGWLLKYVPGVGLSWANEAEYGPGIGVAAKPKPKG